MRDLRMVGAEREGLSIVEANLENERELGDDTIPADAGAAVIMKPAMRTSFCFRSRDFACGISDILATKEE